MNRHTHHDRFWNTLIWTSISVGLALLLFLSTSLSSKAQWPTDPNAPLVICNDASNQRELRVVGDGSGGWYVLWLDNRLAADRYALYGQRVNSQGIAQWEPNGRLVQEAPEGLSLNMVGITRLDNGNLFLAYITGPTALVSGDTVRAMAYDSEGAPVWAEPTLLAVPGILPGGGNGYANYYPRVTPVLNGVFVAWGSWPVGGSDYIHVARVLNDGTNVMPLQGVEVTSLNNSIVSGPWTMRHDMAGGLLLEERWGNGAGAPLYAMRVDSMGNQRWPANLVVSANSGGLAYEWTTAVAPMARVNSIWGNAYDLRMAIYDTTGVLLNPTAPIDVCVHPDVQENPFVVQSEEETTVFWADNRAALGGGRQVFMQRFDATGTPLLATNGVLAMRVNGNINGFPRAFVVNGDEHIVAMVAPFASEGATPGFRVGRVTNTGSNLWSDTTRFCTGALSPNGGTDYALTSDGQGGAMAVWFNWQNDAIYAARVDSSGRLGPDNTIGIVDQVPSAALRVFPVPTNDRVSMVTDAPLLGQRAVIELFDATGKSVLAEQVSALGALHPVDLSSELKEGLYLLMVRVEGQSPRSARVVLRR